MSKTTKASASDRLFLACVAYLKAVRPDLGPHLTAAHASTATFAAGAAHYNEENICTATLKALRIDAAGFLGSLNGPARLDDATLRARRTLLRAIDAFVEAAQAA